jgi:hypothetical protein
MADTGWTTRTATAAGVAAGTGAAQLGLGYGLGVIVWPTIATPDDSVWLGSLSWATWIAASSTVFGAVIAGRLGRVTGAWRFALSLSAAVGALLTVALIALPARTSVRPGAVSPEVIAAGYALTGVLLGLLVAYWAVACRPVAANLIATAAWLWSLAVCAVVASVCWHRPSATYLSSWQFAAPNAVDAWYGTIFWPSAVLTLLAAFIVGVIGALPAARRGDLGVGTASSGAVGPLLVASAFLALAPQLTTAAGPLESAYLIAPYAVLAGLAGSALTVSGYGRRAERGSAPEPLPAPAPPPAAAGPGTAERSRPSLLGRLRRSRAADEDAADRSQVATGRAKAPAPPAAEATTNPGAGSPAAARSARGKSSPGQTGRSKPAPAGSESTAGRGQAKTQAEGERSTVSRPPADPPVAKINKPRSGEKPAAAPPGASSPGAQSSSAQADDASSDKSASTRKSATKATNAAPGKPQPGNPAAPGTSPALPGGGAGLWVDDAVAPPASGKLRRFGRRPDGGRPA